MSNAKLVFEEFCERITFKSAFAASASFVNLARITLRLGGQEELPLT